jgi:hypothetical protein
MLSRLARIADKSIPTPDIYRGLRGRYLKPGLKSSRIYPMETQTRYEWLRRSRTLLYDAYWPPFYPELGYNAQKGIAVAKRMLRFIAKEPYP